RAADRRLVDRDHAGPLRHGTVDERTLARTGDAGHHTEHAEWDVHAHITQVVPGRVADLEPAGWLTGVRLEGGTVPEAPTGERATGGEGGDGTREADRAAPRARAGAEVHDVVRDRDHLRLVLHHEHGVALVPQPEQQVVHPLDVVGVQPDRRLVEDVG